MFTPVPIAPSPPFSHGSVSPGGDQGSVDGATTTTAGTGGSIGRRRKEELWSVTVEGRPYVFHSLDLLIAFLDSRELKEEKRASAKAEKDALRIIATGKRTTEPPKVHITSPTQEIRDYAADVQAKVDRVYWRALASAMAREAEEYEDIKFIAEIDFD